MKNFQTKNKRVTFSGKMNLSLTLHNILRQALLFFMNIRQFH